MKNHFHLCISIRSLKEIIKVVKRIPESDRTAAMNLFIESKIKDLNKLIISQFRRLFISYSQSLNKQINRKGNLFNYPFKRTLFDLEESFSYVLYYIHHNARKHGIVNSFVQHEYISYHCLIKNEPTFLKKDFIFDWFGGKKSFIDYITQFIMKTNSKGFG